MAQRDEAEVFVAAEQALTDVVHQIRADQWQLAIPAWFPIGATQDRATLTLRAIVGYHAYDDAWVPDVLAGRTVEEVGDAHEGDLLGGEDGRQLRTRWDAIVARAVEAGRAADLDRTVHLSYGDWSARDYLSHVTSFRGMRALDISRLIGSDPPLPDQLVADLWEQVAPQAEEWRGWGVFGPAVDVPADAPLVDRLLGITGREPR